MQITLATTPAESLVAAGNIFVGQVGHLWVLLNECITYQLYIFCCMKLNIPGTKMHGNCHY